MNSYILIRRLRGPVILLLIGGLALLHQMGVIDHFWHLFWPLILILVGLMMLAERFALAAQDGTLPGPAGGYTDPYAGAPYGGTPYTNAPYPAPGPIVTPPPASTAIVPADAHDFDINKDRHNGGQS